MNKSIKRLLCIGGICAVLGGAAVIVCLALSAAGLTGFRAPRDYFDQLENIGGFDILHDAGEEYIADEFHTDHFSAGAAEVDGITVKLKNCELDIVSAANDNISVHVEKNSGRKVAIQLKNGILVIEDKRTHHAAQKVLKMTISVPQSKEFTDVKVQMGAGELDCERLYAKTVRLETGAGEVDIENCTILDHATIQGGVGEISIGLTGEKTDYNYEVATGVGEIKLFDEKYSALGKSLSIDNQKDRTITFECGVGEIEIYQAK